jgi:hypothetical protein
MGAVSSTSSYVDMAIKEVSTQSFKSKQDCSSKESSSDNFIQRMSGCGGDSRQVIDGVNINSNAVLTVKCMQDSVAKAMTEEEIAEKLRANADAMVKGLGLGGTALAKTVVKDMTDLAFDVKIEMKQQMATISRQVANFEQSAKDCTQGDKAARAEAKDKHLQLIRRINIATVVKSTQDAILKINAVIDTKRKLTTEVDGRAAAFVEGLSLNLTWPMAVVLVAGLAVAGYVGREYITRVSGVVGSTIQKPEGALKLIFGLIVIVFLTVMAYRYFKTK